ncbi:MAG: hypothetical protein AW08_00929 [Candidatus Accumulibacter adjunctus]|uniref:Uncharacterized protein n=1 Tax=Candidatus Accumulibacter adjunctus TaxID=1454001 RepID=A0A011NVK1_9PROT|nr:MAG: hypothetical protein AW08_00929 [Candidatus Accumulibacter adjunctus]
MLLGHPLLPLAAPLADRQRVERQAARHDIGAALLRRRE